MGYMTCPCDSRARGIKTEADEQKNPVITSAQKDCHLEKDHPSGFDVGCKVKVSENDRDITLQEIQKLVQSLPPQCSAQTQRMLKNLNVLMRKADGANGKIQLHKEDNGCATSIAEETENKTLEVSPDTVEVTVEERNDPMIVKQEAPTSNDVIRSGTWQEKMLEQQDNLDRTDVDELQRGASARFSSQPAELLEMPSQECIIQFSSPEFICTEGEDAKAVLDIMRLGDASQPCSCKFATSNLSAVAGLKFEATHGTVHFEEGQSMTQIGIPIIDDDCWDTTLEFRVSLSEAKGAILGKYLWKTRVKIVDNDCFPTNKYAEQIRANAEEGKYQQVDFGLLKEYFRMNHRNPTVRKGTWKMCLYGQVNNFYFIWQLIITKQIIDKVLPPKCVGGGVLWVVECPEGDKDAALELLVVLMVLFIVPYAFVHYFEYRSKFWKIGGCSRKTLQANLLRKFLNYNEQSRNLLKMSDLMMAMNRDSFDLATNGYMQLFPLVITGCRLILVVALQFALKLYFASIPVFLFPTFLITWLHLRSKKTRKCLKERDNAQNALVCHVENTVKNYGIIADYQMRPAAVDEFEELIGHFNVANAKANAVRVNNQVVSSWLSIIFTGGWFVIGGNMVLDGSDSLGAFLTTLAVFKDVGNSWASIYTILLTMQTSLVPLARITTLMNMTTDLQARKRVNRLRRQLGEQARQDARADIDSQISSAFAADRVPIKLINVAYKHDQAIAKASMDAEFHGCNIEFAQGSFVVIVGEPGRGKATLIKLMGSVLFPTEGVVAIPPHLRVRHISQIPVFFHGTLMQNLTYGVAKDDPWDSDAKRVVAILKRLKVQDQIIPLLDPEHDSKHHRELPNWNDMLSLSQRALLHLARALVNNPEVLVLHKPTLYLDEEMTANTFKVLRDFVNDKGLEQDPAGKANRRPRTCITTTKTQKGVQIADKVFEIFGDKVEEVDKNKVHDSKLQ